MLVIDSESLKIGLFIRLQIYYIYNNKTRKSQEKGLFLAILFLNDNNLR